MDKPHLSEINNEFCSSNCAEKCLNLLDNFKEDKVSDYKEVSSNLMLKKEIIEKKLSSQLDECKQIQKELDGITSGSSEDPNTYILKLYQQITNLTPDPDRLPNEVKGFVSKPFYVFNLDKEKHSEFFISNHLWKHIGSEED